MPKDNNTHFFKTPPQAFCSGQGICTMGAYKTWGSIASQDLGGLQMAFLGLKNSSSQCTLAKKSTI
jgi:hypothetical protein